MGNIKKISSIILSALLLAGCYSDKGNYDYALDTMNEITSVTFTPSVVISAEGDVIEVQQALEEDDRTRRIDAIVEQSLAKNLEELDFYWCPSSRREEREFPSALNKRG